MILDEMVVISLEALEESHDSNVRFCLKAGYHTSPRYDRIPAMRGQFKVTKHDHVMESSLRAL
jgi:hypothetical protein